MEDAGRLQKPCHWAKFCMNLVCDVIPCHYRNCPSPFLSWSRLPLAEVLMESFTWVRRTVSHFVPLTEIPTVCFIDKICLVKSPVATCSPRLSLFGDKQKYHACGQSITSFLFFFLLVAVDFPPAVKPTVFVFIPF